MTQNQVHENGVKYYLISGHKIIWKFTSGWQL
jgi:hypothetical protein